MIRTIIWYIWFFLSLIISVPFTFRVKYLIKKNRIDESEALIYKCTTTWANSLLKIAGVKVNVHGVESVNLYQSKNGETMISRDVISDRIDFVGSSSGNTTTNKTMIMNTPVFTNRKKAEKWCDDFMKVQSNSIVEVVSEKER